MSQTEAGQNDGTADQADGDEALPDFLASDGDDDENAESDDDREVMIAAE